ncbi:alpha/beta hydrolase [Paludisphaera rhizosphaerae]|uniref:alpha/beta hydrolase n=1 Tax=Paludisphaera rhizosphaerae TaxID=2711216 RepID=UPI0013ECBEB9|nr:alpha/beta hydrolase [Paludisphaera rhizosphaerae]
MATTLRGIGWLLTLAVTVHIAASSRNPQTPWASDLRVIQGIPYKSIAGEPLRYDLLLPLKQTDDPHRLPLVVAIHGGSWTGGSRTEYGPQFAPLARGGFAVAVVDYRLARPGAPSWPGALEDVRSALQHILDRADEFQLDTTRVAMLGTSAGGLLAARAAQIDPQVSAAVCLSTPYNLEDLVSERRLRHDPVRTFLGNDPALFKEASPLNHVEASGPATLSIHGGDDAWVPVDQARKMHERLKEKGTFNRLIVIPEARHGFELRVGAPNAVDLTPEIFGFLNDFWRQRTLNDGLASS